MVRFEFVSNGNRFARCVGEMDVEIGPICAKISFERMGNETFAESVKRIGQLVTNIERVILSRVSKSGRSCGCEQHFAVPGHFGGWWRPTAEHQNRQHNSDQWAAGLLEPASMSRALLTIPFFTARLFYHLGIHRPFVCAVCHLQTVPGDPRLQSGVPAQLRPVFVWRNIRPGSIKASLSLWLVHRLAGAGVLCCAAHQPPKVPRYKSG